MKDGSNRFGHAVAVGGGKVAVGAYYAPGGNTYRCGRVHIFDLDGSNEIIVEPGDLSTNKFFGYSVAIGNNKLYVGAYGDNFYRGAVYIYDLDGTNEVKVTASDAANYDYLGWALDADGGKFITGAPYHEDSGYANTGAAYIFDADGTNEVKLVASDKINYDNYGRSVAINSTKAVVGSPYNDACLLYTSPSPRDAHESRMPSSA